MSIELMWLVVTRANKDGYDCSIASQASGYQSLTVHDEDNDIVIMFNNFSKGDPRNGFFDNVSFDEKCGLIVSGGVKLAIDQIKGSENEHNESK